MAVEGFPTRPGIALIKASTKGRPRKAPLASKIANPLLKIRKRQLGTPPVANGGTVTGAATSTSRVGY